MKEKTLLFSMFILIVLLSGSVSAQDLSLRWSVDGIESPSIDATVFEDQFVTLALSDTEAMPDTLNLNCQNLATDEIGSTRLIPIQHQVDSDELVLKIDLSTQWLGLPYPVNPWALESKPLAIISERATRSPYRMTQAEIRDEFAWTSGYMLETARHSYELPLGDGVLTCQFLTAIDDNQVESQELRVVFGRGLPETVFDRNFSLPDVSDWQPWIAVSDSSAEPIWTSDSNDIDQLLMLQAERTPEQIATIRKWDNGAAPSPWMEISLSSVIENHVNPPRASRVYALVSVAIHDALVEASQTNLLTLAPCRVDDRIQPIMPCSASETLPEHAIAAGAASTVLRYLFPNQADLFADWADEALQSQLWAGASHPSQAAAGFAFGQRIGEQVILHAQNDGSDTIFGDTVPQGENNWVPDLPAYAGPQEALTGTWQPWNLSSGDQFRPPPPPAFGTPDFEAGMREVYEVSQELTLEQQQIASFWEDKLGTYTPSGHWVAIAIDLVKSEGLSSMDAARVYATLNTAGADAFIAAWDSKYTYWSIRPVTSIQRTIDSTWTPYVYTPPFPSYISGHATTSGASAEVLANLFPEHRDQLLAWGEEAAMSRLYGGIHFRIDNDMGLMVGRQVAHAALSSIGIEAVPGNER